MEHIIVIFSTLLVVVEVTQVGDRRGRYTDDVNPIRKNQGDAQYGVDGPTCIEHKLIEHSEALGDLLKMAKTNELRSKTLLEKLNALADSLRQIQTEAPLPSRRAISRKSEPVKLSPLTKLGKEVSNYGEFYKHLLFDRVDDDSDSAPGER